MIGYAQNYAKIRRLPLGRLRQMPHWLDKLLSPKTIAVVGASEREGSLAAATILQLSDTGFDGELYLINPKYQVLFDQPCYTSLKSLPESPDLVVFAISGLALEQSFEEAIAIGAGGIIMYASNLIEEEASTPLTQRLRKRAAKSGIPVCGGNSMGFYNYDHNVMVSFDRPPRSRPPGHIGLIAHSGSAMTYLANNDARFCFNYVIASGQETNADVGDYMDYLLEQPSTRVIALFIETVRNPAGFVAALKKARDKDIPVVITKLGRTEKSAALAVSHSGAIVGDHEVFLAVCRRHGAVVCRDIDELIVSALLYSLNYKVQSGAVSSLLDSGGMREQMIDLADDYGVYFAEVSAHTLVTMQQHLEYGLHADNPLDGMGALGRNTEQTYLECGKAMLDDPETGLLTYEFEFRDGFSHYPVMFDVIEQLNAYSSKPLIVINSCTYTTVSETAADLCQKGVAVINGIDVAMRAIKNLFRYDSETNATTSPALDAPHLDSVKQCRSALSCTTEVDEFTSLALLSELGLPVIANALAEDLDGAIHAANRMGYPVALKTAARGIHHKSDSDGVKLAIRDDSELKTAYEDLHQRLGRRVLVTEMVRDGVELALGMKNDPQYGPVIMLAAGGILVELLNDHASELAPLNVSCATDMLNSLKISKFLSGVRGRPACDTHALLKTVVRFSQVAFELADSIVEIDLNPVIVQPAGCTIVDALIVPRQNQVAD